MDIAYSSNGNKLQQYCYKAIKESKWLVSEQPILQTSKIAYMWIMTKLVLFEVVLVLSGLSVFANPQPLRAYSSELGPTSLNSYAKVQVGTSADIPKSIISKQIIAIYNNILLIG